MQGGDITLGNGTGGESIYGIRFKDENFNHQFSQPGMLAMSNKGQNTNSSQFFITFDSFPHLDGQYVVFGRVSSGMEVLR